MVCTRSGVWRAKTSASRLARAGATCWATMSAAGRSAGRSASTRPTASTPPAEAPVTSSAGGPSADRTPSPLAAMVVAEQDGSGLRAPRRRRAYLGCLSGVPAPGDTLRYSTAPAPTPAALRCPARITGQPGLGGRRGDGRVVPLTSGGGWAAVQGGVRRPRARRHAGGARLPRVGLDAHQGHLRRALLGGGRRGQRSAVGAAAATALAATSSAAGAWRAPTTRPTSGPPSPTPASK